MTKTQRGFKLILSIIAIFTLSASIKSQSTTGTPKSSVSLKTGKLELKSSNSQMEWTLKTADGDYLISLYPNEKIKSSSSSEEALDGIKTATLESPPIAINDSSFITKFKVVAKKDFLGVMFVVERTNLGKTSAPFEMNCLLYMKDLRYFDHKGEKSCGAPWNPKSGMSNWVFLPSGKKGGLALIRNFKETDASFMSNYGRVGLDGKHINEVATSTWQIRRNMLFKPGETGKLCFVIAPAKSPEEAAEICERIKTKKIFPSLKLRNVDDRYKPSIPIVKSELKDVEPIFNEKLYSAGGFPADEIDKIIKREIRPDEFDIWHDRKDRIYLNGSWKLIKLANTLERPDCEYGIKHGFEKPDFDDSKWFNQPVPLSWNVKWKNFVPIISKKKEKFGWITGFGGVGWYRRNFTIPEKNKGERVILHFQGVEQKAIVYVNGVKVVSNETIQLENVIHHGRLSYDAFEVDITKHLRFGENNTVAVRVFDNGDTNRHDRKRYPGIAGIWQEVYLELRPEIYLQKALITPNLKSSSIDVKSVIVNSSKEDRAVDLKIILEPWKSKRYKLADWPATTNDLGRHTLKPGRNEINFSVKIDKPHLWSPEDPRLYHMKMIDSNGGLLGQERFGFRELIAGSDYFHLNGEKIMMRGDQAEIATWSQCPGFKIMDIQMGILNRKNALGKFLDMYKDLNYNIMRTHSTFHPHAFHELCDEKGLMICIGNYFMLGEPFFDKDCKMTPRYSEKIKKIAHEMHKYPSVTLLSMVNEPFDNKLIGTKHKSWQPGIDQVYDEFKKHIKNVPMACAGRPPTKKAAEKFKYTGNYPSEAYAKTDFYSIHNYQPGWNDLPHAEEDDCKYSMKYFRDAFTVDGGPKVMLATEANISSLHAIGHWDAKRIDKIFSPHIKNGKIDKKYLADEWQYISRFNTAEQALNMTVKKFGFLSSVSPHEIRMKAQAEWTKRIHELSRRQRKDCAGIMSNQAFNFFGSIFKTEFDDKLDSYYNKPVAEATTKANQPVLACFDFKRNRNLFSGDKCTEPVYIMNDHEKEISEVLTEISLISENADKTRYALGSLRLDLINIADMLVEEFNFTLPVEIPTGHYKMCLSVSYKKGNSNKVLKSINDYSCFVMNRSDIKLQNIPSEKVALLVSDKDKITEKALSGLGVKFDKLKDFKQLDNYKKLILGPFSYSRNEEDKILMNWLRKGGDLLSFAQTTLPKDFRHEVKPAGPFGYFSELIEWDHPIFKDLRQDDFRTWNAKRGKVGEKWIFHYSMTPIDEGMLSTQMIYSKRMSMTSAAYRIGNGKMILSQFESLKRFGTDSVATKLSLNILDWGFDGYHGLEFQLPEISKKTKVKVSADAVDFIDISKQCDMGFADEIAHDGKGGWTDQGPNNDLSRIPTGKHIFNGVPFKIIDPKNNSGKSCIVLQGKEISKTGFLPEKVKIPIGAEYKKLYFLVSCAWCFEHEKDIGNLRIVADAKGIEMATVFDIKLTNKFNIADWWDPSSHKPPFAELGWLGPNRNQTKEVGTYIIEWSNPLYGKGLKLHYVEFESYKKAVPVLLGITAEK